MKFVIGLGNPGAKYAGTRHNAGYDVVAELARRHGQGKPVNKFDADIVDAVIDGEKVLLVAPVTFMNLSGRCVSQLVRFFQPDFSDIVVVCDDLNLPTGRVRWRPSGSAGGQKGLKDIIEKTGTQEIPRLRIGIGRPPGKMEVTSWVLSRFRPDEQDDIQLAITRAADSVEKWVRDGIEQTMTEYNRPVENGT